MIIDIIFSKRTILLVLAVAMLFPFSASADENLAIYGLRGYAYTFSPLPSNGFHVQAGAMHSQSDGKIENGDGYKCFGLLSMTYGDGKWWEISASSHWERWENTSDYWENQNVDLDQEGIGDLFIGAKLRLLGKEKEQSLDLSLMPYALIPIGGNRDKSIGDLYFFNPSTDDDLSYGINLLMGKGWHRFYITGNVGINYVDTDQTGIEDNGIFFGLALEFQIAETLTSYVEFINIENKIKSDCAPCYNEDTEEDLREIGAGVLWIQGKWGFKLHGGTGITDTTPNFRVLGLINRNF